MVSEIADSGVGFRRYSPYFCRKGSLHPVRGHHPMGPSGRPGAHQSEFTLAFEGPSPAPHGRGAAGPPLPSRRPDPRRGRHLIRQPDAPALHSQVGRLTALLPSIELARDELRSQGPTLDEKTVHWTLFVLGLKWIGRLLDKCFRSDEWPSDRSHSPLERRQTPSIATTSLDGDLCGQAKKASSFRSRSSRQRGRQRQRGVAARADPLACALGSSDENRPKSRKVLKWLG
jgi:hypothetical protein